MMGKEEVLAIDIIMPHLGESVAEGTIIAWLIPQGARVGKDQMLLEVETDKVALEIPSPESGVVDEIFVQEGQTVPVGTLLARLGAEEASTEVVNRAGGMIVRPTTPPESALDRYSPAVRQFARKHEVNLSLVKGTGVGGRITKKNVMGFIAKRQKEESISTAGHQEASPMIPIRTLPIDDKVLPLTTMRQTIAERMVRSRQTSAHVVTFFEVDFSEITKVRVTHELTYLPFVITAVTRSLRDVPMCNASWGEAGIIMKQAIHIGIAVALDEGLLVPVIRNADQKGLKLLANEIADLAERARTKQLYPEEVQGGTFSITNHGGFGSLFSTPIINQPQTAILGVGAVQKRTAVIDDAIAIRPICYLSFSFDHRVIDGATADQFMSRVKTNLEHSDWETLL
jgi:2-oxoglutarate dehydrogenase E2 component (dihydrolipoamide succinyltransferase)/2-oxoisovalerate dehydrogenase E2 component (dihydrolipoyl transacylase)